jgi:hypothetical protein
LLAGLADVMIVGRVLADRVYPIAHGVRQATTAQSTLGRGWVGERVDRLADSASHLCVAPLSSR